VAETTRLVFLFFLEAEGKAETEEQEMPCPSLVGLVIRTRAVSPCFAAREKDGTGLKNVAAIALIREKQRSVSEFREVFCNGNGDWWLLKLELQRIVKYREEGVPGWMGFFYTVGLSWTWRV
jgi:hypothetical protein